MKIVTRKELMELPAGTVFSYYEPCVFHDLNIKDSEPNDGSPDFVISGLIGSVAHTSSEEFVENCEKMQRRYSMPVDFELTGREGLFDHEQLFAVYERADVEILIERLKNTL